MKLMRFLASSLVSSALLSSSVSMALFPMPQSVGKFYESCPEKAEMLEDAFSRRILEAIPLLKCVNTDVIPDDGISASLEEDKRRDYGSMPFAINVFKNGNFEVLRFEDTKPERRMRFECVLTKEGVGYRLDGVGEYGNGPNDYCSERRALADYLIEKYFFKFYNELNSIERELFFYILADKVDNCIDVYGDY